MENKVEEQKENESGPSAVKHKDTMWDESLDFLLIKYWELTEEMEDVKKQNLNIDGRIMAWM